MKTTLAEIFAAAYPARRFAVDAAEPVVRFARLKDDRWAVALQKGGHVDRPGDSAGQGNRDEAVSRAPGGSGFRLGPSGGF